MISGLFSKKLFVLQWKSKKLSFMNNFQKIEKKILIFQKEPKKIIKLSENLIIDVNNWKFSSF